MYGSPLGRLRRVADSTDAVAVPRSRPAELDAELVIGLEITDGALVGIEADPRFAALPAVRAGRYRRLDPTSSDAVAVPSILTIHIALDALAAALGTCVATARRLAGMRPGHGRPSMAVEDYLKAIYVLGEHGGDGVSTSLVAERMAVAPSSVSAMVRKLRELDLVVHHRYGTIALTGEGTRLALGVVRRHRLIEQLLVTEFDYSWDEVHEEAEALEHVVSDRLIDAIAERLGHPRLDPHGDPIPDRTGEIDRWDAQRLSEVSPGAEGDLVRVDDDTAVLRHLTAHEIALGDRIGLVRREPFGGPFVVRTGGRELQFGPELVDALWVRVQV